MNPDLQESYRLIIDFLRNHKHLKAVDALMKSTGKLGLLIPSTTPEGLDLVSIVKNWRASTLRTHKLLGVENGINKTVITNDSKEYTLKPKSKSIPDGSFPQSKMKAGLKEKPNKRGKGGDLLSSTTSSSDSSSDSASDSSSDSSSESSSSENDSSSHSDREEPPPVKLPVPVKEKAHSRPIQLGIKRKAAPSTSSSSGSSCDSDDEKASFTNVAVAEKEKGSVRVGNRRQGVASSSPNSPTPSNSDNGGPSSIKVTAPGNEKTASASIQVGTIQKAVPSSSRSHDSSSSDDSSSSSDAESNKLNEKGPKRPITIQKILIATEPKIIEQVDKPTHKDKKRRVDEIGASVVTQSPTIPSTTASSITISVNGSIDSKDDGKQGSSRTNTRFQRVKASEVTFADERLKNNAFNAKGGTEGDYGAKASADLIVTRGAGFRKEKSKKKRGSYRGGEITMESHSIKFT